MRIRDSTGCTRRGRKLEAFEYSLLSHTYFWLYYSERYNLMTRPVDACPLKIMILDMKFIFNLK